MDAAPDGGGATGGRTVDVQVNLVPFIDLMSCLVAFLLVTAAWTGVRQLPTKVGGRSPGGDIAPDTARLAVLVAADGLWIGDTMGNRERIDRQDGEQEFAALERALAARRTDGEAFAGRTDLEVAAEDGVPYGTLVSALDTAIGAGFADVAVTDPGSLSVRFRR